MSIQPVAVVHLDHRAFLMRGNANPFGLIVGNQKGQLSLINQRFECRPVSLSTQIGTIRSVSIDTSFESIAVVNGAMITVATLNGDVRSQLEPPKPDSNATEQFVNKFSSCHFDSDNSLWSVAGTSERSIAVQLRDPDNGKIIDRCILADPYGSSFSSFFPTPDREMVALWITAGQDGQIINWLNKRNGLSAKVETQLSETIPPEFSANGSEFLVSDSRSVRRFSFPEVKETGRWSGETLEDDSPGTSLAWIDEQTALTGTFECRLFRINLQSMTLADEVKLEFPDGVTKDSRGFSHFQLVGDFLIFVCRRESKPEWKDSLVIYKAVDFQTS